MNHAIHAFSEIVTKKINCQTIYYNNIVKRFIYFIPSWNRRGIYLPVAIIKWNYATKLFNGGVYHTKAGVLKWILKKRTIIIPYSAKHY